MCECLNLLLYFIKYWFRVQSLMTCARGGSQWPVVRSSGWSTSPPTGWTPCSGCSLNLTSSLFSRNLHSHHFSSPLTNQQEVSAFGEMGEGDTGDVWKVMILIEKLNETNIFFKGCVWHRLLATGPGSPVQARWHWGLPGIQRADLWSPNQWTNGDYWHKQTWRLNQVANPRGLIRVECFAWMTLLPLQGIYIHPSDFNPKRQQMGHDEL